MIHDQKKFLFTYYQTLKGGFLSPGTKKLNNENKCQKNEKSKVCTKEN